MDDKRYLLDDVILSLAFGNHEIPTRVTDIEDDAQDGVVMSQADAARDYGIVSGCLGNGATTLFITPPHLASRPSPARELQPRWEGHSSGTNHNEHTSIQDQETNT